MKIRVDPMPALRTAAAARVTAHFSTLALADIHREMAWRRKREIAVAVFGGAGAPAQFAEEAALRGLTPAALADLIVEKPDPAAALDARELQRQKKIIAIEACRSPQELDELMRNYGGN